MVWVAVLAGVMLRLWISNWMVVPVVSLLLTFLVTAFSTSKIFQIARRHQRQINDQNVAGLSLQSKTVNVLKCRKSAATVLYVYGLFLVTYLPFCVTMIIKIISGYTRPVKIASEYATSTIFINSFLNPLVYCWRIREIRRAVKDALRNGLPESWLSHVTVSIEHDLHTL